MSSEVEDAVSDPAANGDDEVDEADPDSCISYADAAKYWDGVAPTVEGMLGGFGKISPVDIEGSNKFLKGIFKLDRAPGNARALDCGAGIGRVTKFLLQRHFLRVDLVEQNPKFLERAPKYLSVGGGADNPKLGELFCSGLQDFTPEAGCYDVIWCQWVLGHLTERDLEAFFGRCSKGLRSPNGVIVVKENVTSSGEVERDEEDSSVTRPDSLLREVFARCGLRLLRSLQQRKFPDELYPVRMYALRPQEQEEGDDDEDSIGQDDA